MTFLAGFCIGVLIGMFVVVGLLVAAGLECVVLLRGRGVDILAYSRDATGPDRALALTESGRLTLAKHVRDDTYPGPFN